MSTDIGGTTRFEEICEMFVDEYNASYVAIPEQTLLDNNPVFLYNVHPSNKSIKEFKESLGNQLSKINRIHLNDNEVPVQFYNVLHSEIHDYQRALIYVESQPGLEDVSLEEGIANVRNIANDGDSLELSKKDTIELQKLVAELADAGAASVELRDDPYIISQTVDLRIPITPAVGYRIAGPYDEVTVDGQRYDFSFTCDLDGPAGLIGFRTPLYIADTVMGSPPVPVDDGMDYFETIQTIVEDDESKSEYDRIREAKRQWREDKDIETRK